jgi:hypothetical protein
MVIRLSKFHPLPSFLAEPPFHAHLSCSYRRIQANLQRAINCAPTPLHRTAKEELLRPLSLSQRQLRIPAAASRFRPAPPALQHSSGSANIPIPLTPQPAMLNRSVSVAPAHQLHHPALHHSQHLMLSQFHGLSSEANSATAAFASGSPPAHQHIPPHQMAPTPAPAARPQGSGGAMGAGGGAPFHLHRQASTPHQSSMQMGASAAYRASPLSRLAPAGGQCGTPTRSSAAQPQNQLPFQHQPPQQQEAPLRWLEQEEAQQLKRHQQMQQRREAVAAGASTSSPGTPPADQIALDTSLQMRLMALSEPGRGDAPLSQQDMQALLQSTGAHGMVQISRAGLQSQQQQQPASPPSAKAMVAASDVRATPQGLLKRLFIPNSASHPGDELIHNSPGPAGPGIKERLKFHLSRQAGP